MTTDRRDFLKYTLGSMIAIGASGYLAACGGDDDSASGSTSTSAGATTTKPVELQKISAMMPFAVGINFIADTAAAAGGFFKDNGLDMNLQFAQSAPLALQQLAAGNVDVIRNAPIAVVKAVSQEGAPFVAIGMPNQEMLYRLVTTSDKPVDDLASLEGKTVGMATLAGNAEDTFVLVLKGAGVNPDSVTRVAVGNDAAALAFVEDGRVDALFATLESTAPPFTCSPTDSMTSRQPSRPSGNWLDRATTSITFQLQPPIRVGATATSSYHIVRFGPWKF